MKFNEKILDLRKKKGLSQDELGEKMNVSRQTISKWENGQSYPDFERLVLLSDYFELTLDELVRDIDVQDIREKGVSSQQLTYIEKNIKDFKKYCVYTGYVMIVTFFIALIIKVFIL